MLATKVFISYSRRDVALVKPIVQILRLNQQFVFLDIDSLTPGKRWRDALEQHLKETALVVVFWCLHSNSSAEVKREYELALVTKKDIVPLLLDNTPLPDELGVFQGIDCRETVKHRENVGERVKKEALRAASRARWAVAVMYRMVVTLVDLYLWGVWWGVWLGLFWKKNPLSAQVTTQIATAIEAELLQRSTAKSEAQE